MPGLRSELRHDLPGSCPEFAKIGSLTLDSSALPGPLPGFVYLGQPLPGNRYRIFLVADGFGTHIKLAGIVTPDPITGRVSVTFDELPQSPLTAFDMHIFGSERGLLATPTQCGTYAVTSTFEPWDDSLGAQSSTHSSPWPRARWQALPRDKATVRTGLRGRLAKSQSRRAR